MKYIISQVLCTSRPWIQISTCPNVQDCLIVGLPPTAKAFSFLVFQEPRSCVAIGKYVSKRTGMHLVAVPLVARVRELAKIPT